MADCIFEVQIYDWVLTPKISDKLFRGFSRYRKIKKIRHEKELIDTTRQDAIMRLDEIFEK